MMMMEDNYLAGALFPVVFFDGEREIDLGTVVITPAMTFHSFRSIISQKIGISYHQLTIYFERTTPFHHHHRGPRHPVTNKFNFSAAMIQSSSSFFRAVLKRSRRHRRRRHKSPAAVAEMEKSFVLLRRNNPNLEHEGFLHHSLTRIHPYLDYAKRVSDEMEREKERYLMSLNLNSDVYSDLIGLCYSTTSGHGGFGLSSDDGASSSGGASSDRVMMSCDVCLKYSRMEGETVPFHWCKNDAVTSPFRSHAGPIGPVPKSRFVDSEYN